MDEGHISLLVIGFVIIILAFILQYYGWNPMFLYGWGCANVFIAINYRNYEFKKVE